MATFRTFFEENLTQARATVLVQGPHLSGKSTLLNALLGSHLFPYFHSQRYRHGGEGRFTAGQGATSVCIVGAAILDGAKLLLTQPATASITYFVAPNALLVGGDSFSDTAAGKTAPRAEDRALVSSFSESQSRMESSYFTPQGSAGVMSRHPVDHTIVQPFRQALNSMEATWLQWLEEQGAGTVRTASAGSNQADGTAERLLFFADLHSAVSSEPGIPFLNFVESTDLSDRPPMTYVHTTIVVLSEASEGFGFEDREGARRMYVKSATYAKTNTVAAIVYNLTQTKTGELSTEDRESVKQSLSRLYDVDSDSIFVLNLRNALADALLRQQSTEGSLISPLDWEELGRLRGLIARSHMSAYSRSQLRLQNLSKASPVAGFSGSGNHPLAAASLPTASERYIPKTLSEQYRREDSQVASVAADASAPREGRSGGADLTLKGEAKQQEYVPVVSREATVEAERALLRRKAEQEAKAATATVEKLHHGQEVARCASESQESYTPKCLQGVPLERISPPPVEAKRSPQQPPQKSPPYIPKCVLARRESEEVAAATVDHQKHYVPKFLSNSQPMKESADQHPQRVSPPPSAQVSHAVAPSTAKDESPSLNTAAAPIPSNPDVAQVGDIPRQVDAALPIEVPLQVQPDSSSSPKKGGPINSFSTSSSFDMLDDNQ